jgi:hypothetical protein
MVDPVVAVLGFTQREKSRVDEAHQLTPRTAVGEVADPEAEIAPD